MTKLRFGIAVAILLLLSQIGSAQTIMSPLSGTVTDASGAVLVDANVTVTNMANNITNNTVTNQKGQFVFPSLPPATYKVLVDKEGFKTYQRTGIVMTANNPVSLGMIALQVGSVVDKIEVHSEGEALQTQTAAVGTAIVGKQLENIQVNGRSFLGLLRLVPGVYSDGAFQSPSNQTGNVTANGSRGQQFNITINGASNLDTGSNTKMYSTISLDAVQEFRVMTSSYQAEFGKTSGAQISVVTKSGTDTFHGGAYWYYRDKGLNATNWDNKRRNMAKAAYHYNFFGYTLGGPVFVPNKFNANKDKLFFFWYNEFQQMVIPHGVKTVTLPTDEERHGNFSNSVNSSGNPVTIQDCIHRDAANNCVPFVDGTVTGQIPAAYQYGPGMALLDWLYQIGQGKLGQTVPGQKGYNFQSAISDTNPRVEGLLRMDYNFSPRIKIYGTWSPLFSDTYTSYYCPSGYSLCTNLPLTPIHYAHPGFVLAGTVVQTFSPSLVNETTVDWGKHPVTIAPEKADVWTRAGTGVKLDTMYSPYMDWMPNINFSGAIGNAPRLNDGSGGAWTPYNGMADTFEVIDNLSKLVNTHNVKMGVYIQRSHKNQSAYISTSGSYDFGNTTNNPNDTNFGYANAAIGTYNQYTQASHPANGQYYYTNAEFYIQDTWQVKPRFVVDAGIRAYYMQPQYDRSYNTSNFFPQLFDPNQVPRLYYPTKGTDPVTGAPNVNIGIDNATGNTVINALMGTIVPGTGSFTNGIRQATVGVNKYLMNNRGMLWGPRLGFTFDVTGRQSLVVRGGGGIFYDRYQGNIIINTIANPPAGYQPTVYYGMAQGLPSLGSSGSIPVADIQAIDQRGLTPRTASYNFGFQAKLPASFVLDASYVGSTSRRLINQINLNATPFGSAWLPENQDPTQYTGGVIPTDPSQITGAKSLASTFYRPYLGLGNIYYDLFSGTSNYNSLQLVVNRRFVSGLFMSASYVFSKCLDTGSGEGDGNSVRPDGLSRQVNYGMCASNVPQNFTVNYVYPIPFEKLAMGHSNGVTKRILGGWVLSGVTIFRNGLPFTVGLNNFSDSGWNTNTMFTGSGAWNSRVRIVGDMKAVKSRDIYHRINPDAFAPPFVKNSIAAESRRNYLIGPGVNNFDMTIQKDTKITEKTTFQIRVEAFNVFNHTQFSGYNTGITFKNPTTDQSVTNLASPSNLGGFGGVSGSRDPRILQLVTKFNF